MLEPLIETASDRASVSDSLSDAFVGCGVINRRRILKADWAQSGFALSWMEPNDQRTLHFAFQPSEERMSDADALEEYRALAKHDPGKVAEAAELWGGYERAFERASAEAACREAGCGGEEGLVRRCFSFLAGHGPGAGAVSREDAERLHTSVLVAPASERRCLRKQRRQAAVVKAEAERAERRVTTYLPADGEPGAAALRTPAASSTPSASAALTTESP